MCYSCFSSIGGGILKKFFTKLFFFIFFIIFALIIFFTIFYNKSSYANLKFYESILTFIIYCFFVFILWKFFLSKIKYSRRFFILCFLIFLFLQIIFAFIFAVRPSWDFGAVNDSVIWDLDGLTRLQDNIYFYRYSNNVGIYLLLKLIYFPFHLLGASHFILLGFGLLFNIFFIDLGIFYLYQILSIFFTEKQKNSFFFLSLVFLPFITYVPIFYTDTYSLPFGTMSIYYLFAYLYKNEKKFYLILSGLFLGIGCCIKFSLFIIFIAFVLFFIFRKESCTLKNTIQILGIIIISFIVPLILLQSYIHFTFSSVLLEKESFPKEHYFMMGLSNFGGYNADDVEFTMNIEGTEEKKKADIKRLKEKINDLYHDGKIIEFYINKAVYTWGDGTFFAPRKLALEQIHNYPMKNLILDFQDNHNYLFRLFSQGQYLFVLVFIIFGTLFRSYLDDKQKDLQFLFHMILFGAFLFFLIWEARSRYIVNFIPILLIDSYLGIIGSYRFLKCKKSHL